MKTRGSTSDGGAQAHQKAQGSQMGPDAIQLVSSNGTAAMQPVSVIRSLLPDPIAELQARYDALVREQLQMVQERNQLVRKLAAVPRTERDSAERMVDMEQALLSIRQARDLLLTRNHQLIADLARADDKIAELGYELDTAATARDAALQEKDE